MKTIKVIGYEEDNRKTFKEFLETDYKSINIIETNEVFAQIFTE